MESEDSKRQDFIDSLKFYTAATFAVVTGTTIFVAVLLSVIH